MKKWCLALILSVSVCFSEETSSYSLSKCQAMALQKSQRLSIAELQVGIAREKIREITAINMPKISAEGAYTIRDKHQGSKRTVSPSRIPQPKPQQQGAKPVEQKSLEEQPRTVKTRVGNKKTVTSKFSFIVPVFDFGYVDRLLDAQNHAIEATEEERKRTEQELLLAVAESYYAVLKASKIETVVLQSIKLLTQQLVSAQDLFSVGLVTKNDVLGAEIQLAQRKQELIQIEHNKAHAIANLNRLTELNIKQVSQLDDVSENVSWSFSLQNYLAKVTDEHPELKKIHAKILAVQSERGAVRAENYPEITAFCNFNTSSDTYLLHRNWITTGIGLHIPIFDGGIVESQCKQKMKQQNALELSLDDARDAIELQVTEAFLAVESAYSKIPVAKESIAHAEENLKIDKDLYAEGQIASDDLLNDEERLAQARSNYFQAIYNFKIAQVELAFAVGDIHND